MDIATCMLVGLHSVRSGLWPIAAAGMLRALSRPVTATERRPRMRTYTQPNCVVSGCDRKADILDNDVPVCSSHAFMVGSGCDWHPEVIATRAWTHPYDWTRKDG